jgi:hypothetical protein
MLPGNGLAFYDPGKIKIFTTEDTEVHRVKPYRRGN